MKTTSFVIATATGLLLSTAAGFSQATGIFGTGVGISSDIGGSSTFNLYEITLLGDGRLAPNISGGGVSLGSPTLVNTDNGSGVSTWATAVGGGPSLGTFTQDVDTLTLNGGEELTYKNSGANVTAATVFYSIDSDSFTGYSLAFNEDNVSGNNGDQRWYTDGANVNLLSGLGVGTHTLSIYFQDSNNVDTQDYVSNDGVNYNATFTIAAPVPEPSTVALFGLSGLAMLVVIRRRRHI